jgi:hypothetical protein
MRRGDRATIQHGVYIAPIIQTKNSKLFPEEALYEMERGKLTVTLNNVELSIQHAMQIFPIHSDIYTLYCYLREKGYNLIRANPLNNDLYTNPQYCLVSRTVEAKPSYSVLSWITAGIWRNQNQKPNADGIMLYKLFKPSKHFSKRGGKEPDYVITMSL